MLNSSNHEADVTYSEPVYGDSSASTALLNSSVTIADTTQSLTATMGTITHTAGGTLAKYAVTWTGTPATNDVITVTIVANKIYDAAGNVMPAGASPTTGLAKLLSVFGVQTQPAKIGVKPSTLVGRVNALVQSALFGTVVTGSSSSTIVGSAASAAPAESASSRSQFLAVLGPTSNTAANTGVAAPAPAESARAVAAAPSQAADLTDGKLVASVPASAPVTSVASNSAAPSAPAQLPIAQMTAPHTNTDAGLPPWWIMGLGVLAAAGLTAGLWFALRSIRGREGR